MEYKVKMFRKTVFICSFWQLWVFFNVFLLAQPFFHNLKVGLFKASLSSCLEYELANNPYLIKARQRPTHLKLPQDPSHPVLLYHGIVEREDGSNIWSTISGTNFLP